MIRIGFLSGSLYKCIFVAGKVPFQSYQNHVGLLHTSEKTAIEKI